MIATTLLLLVVAFPGVAPRDTLHLNVGSPEVDLSTMLPHDARVTVERLVGGTWTKVTEWTNHLVVGDSAGRGVHRWTTIGTQKRPDGSTFTWHLYQTFDKRTIAPIAYRRTGSDGTSMQLVVDGPSIKGTRTAADGATTPVDIRLSRAAYPAGASDLVPMGVRLRDGMIMTIPVWQPGMPDVETRVFDVIGRRDVPVAGRTWNAWVVEERALRQGSVAFIGTWYIVDEPPYMVYAEVEGPGGAKQRMIEVSIEPGGASR